jgi:type IV pilus assembly protein PilY1
MQAYNQNMRFAAFGYLADYSKTQDQQGGVLRARMKSVGPTQADPISIATVNPNKEWDATTGVYVVSPDPADVAACPVAVSNSGVMNYLNKFGQAADPATGYAYKYFDPMAELYYDSVRYLKGLSYSTFSYTNAVAAKPKLFDGFPAIKFAGKGTADDPVISSCQQNFIIAIGDKNNQPCDTRVPTGAVCANGSLPLGDAANYGAANTEALTSGGKWMGNIAYWAHTNDIRPDLAPNRPTGVIQDITTFIVDVMEDHNYDGTVKTQLWMAAKYGGFDKTLTDQTSAATRNDPNSFKTGSTIKAWDKDGAGVPDNWYKGSDPATLQVGLKDVFQKIVTATSLGDGAAPATSGVSVETATKIYYAGYKLINGGTGTLKACAFTATANACNASPDWDAAVWLDPTSSKPVVTTSYATYQDNTTRQIITRSNGSGKVFSYANLTTAEQNLMKIDPTSKATDALGTDRVNYLRGDSSKEIGKTGGIFRTRATTKLGDIVSSGPVYVGAPNALYFGALFAGYSDFIVGNASRTPIIYAGVNDGMVHAFDAASGKEVFAYVPNYFLQADATTTSARVNSLTMPTYQHQFYVDATPMAGDVNIGGSWKTLLVGGYGAGGKGFYALDITDPGNFSTTMNAESKAAVISMWEISDADDSDIGYTFNQPTQSPISGQALQFALVPKSGGGTEWAIIVGNGFGSAAGKAVLFFLNPADGSELYKVEVESSLGDNGLATPFPVSNAGNGVIDTIWAGDLKGNLWRVRWAGTAWTSSAAFTGAASQPITSAPVATRHPSVAGAWAVDFGTGKYIERSDYNTKTQQTLFGIVDAFSTTAIVKADLVQQTAGTPTTPDSKGDFTRTMSSNVVDFSTNKGWYFDMPTTNGERSISNPIIPADTGVVLMGSFTPASACLAATGYVNALNPYTGGAVAGLPTWGGVGMGIPYFSSVVSSAGVAIVKVGGVRYCPPGESCAGGGSGGDVTGGGCVDAFCKGKSFVHGVRSSWREIR